LSRRRLSTNSRKHKGASRQRQILPRTVFFRYANLGRPHYGWQLGY